MDLNCWIRPWNKGRLQLPAHHMQPLNAEQKLRPLGAQQGDTLYKWLCLFCHLPPPLGALDRDGVCVCVCVMIYRDGVCVCVCYDLPGQEIRNPGSSNGNRKGIAYYDSKKPCFTHWTSVALSTVGQSTTKDNHFSEKLGIFSEKPVAFLLTISFLSSGMMKHKEKHLEKIWRPRIPG